jgi:hypothetical protein
MTSEQKGMFFLLSGMVITMGVVGGIEQCQDLISYDGLYISAFALVALGLMSLGVSYVNE